MIKYIGDNRFKVIDRIGKGLMTEVFLCRAINEDYDEAAIKIYMNKERNEFIENFFYRECEVLEMLRHENIVKLLDKGYDTELESFYLVLEYVEGKTLDKIISNKKLSEDQLNNIVNQLFKSIEYAHMKGILHRDIKPSNIIIDDFGNVKVIDFGISKIINTISSEYTVVQAMTPTYASPEQKLGKTLDYSSDIYSLGILLYELISNEKYKSTMDIQSAINSSKKIDKHLKSILIKMTKDNPNDRYQNIYEVKKEWNSKSNNGEKYYGLKLTKSCINRLKSLYLINEANEIEAKSIIEKDLKEESYITNISNIYKNDTTDRFIIYGKQFELICGINIKDNKMLSVIGVNVPNTFFLEKNKESYGMEVDLNWKINSKVSNIVSIENLLNKYNKFQLRLQKEDNIEVVSKHLFEKWEKVLDIYKDINDKSRKTLRYKNLKYDEKNRKLYLTLSNSSECSFNDEQLLVMSLKSNKNRSYFRTQRAGYFNTVKNGILEIDLLREVDGNIFASSGEVSVDLAYMDSLIDKQQRALKKIKTNQAINKNLRQLLVTPTIAKSRYFAENISYVNKNLDRSKKEAVGEALSAKDLYLLQGPPGTGKTTFISEIVAQTLKYNPKAKILISSQSNVAVNHSMNKIKELIPDINMVRLGKSDKISNGIESYSLEILLDTWIDEIRNRCNKYLSHLKRNNINDEVLEKYNIVSEIKDLRKKLEDTAIAINKAQKDMIELSYKYEFILSCKKDIDIILEKITNFSNAEFNKKEINMTNMIKQDYIKAGEKFIDSFANLPKVRFEKDNLEEKIEHLQNNYSSIKEEIEAGKLILGATKDEDIEVIKADLDKQFKHLKKRIELFSKYEKINKEWIETLNHSDEMDKIFIEDISLIGATCIGIANYSGDLNLKFDLVIIDEAGRATPPEIMVPMSLGKKIILVGDHKQLPPIIDQVLCKEVVTQTDLNRFDLEESLFSYLQKNLSNYCKGSLERQYRMHPAIGNLISETFYQGTITNGIKNEDRKHNFAFINDKPIVWLDTKNNSKRFEQNIGFTKQNNFEAEIIFELLEKLDKENIINKVTKKEVGVIAGYSGQKNLLNRMLLSKFENKFKTLSIEIDTVDAFQGRETDIVIYSIVRSNLDGEIGFLSDERRLNVALSRAKELLFLVGDSKCVSSKLSKNPFNDVYKFIECNNEECKIIEV